MKNDNTWHRIGNDPLPLHAMIWVFDSVYNRCVLTRWDGNYFDRYLRDRCLTHWRHLDVPDAP